jgi:hypothetical protein
MLVLLCTLKNEPACAISHCSRSILGYRRNPNDRLLDLACVAVSRDVYYTVFWRQINIQQRCLNRLSHFSCCPGWRLTSIVWYWSRHGQYSLCFVGHWEQKAYFHCPTSTYTASTLLLWSTVALALLSQSSSRIHHEWTLVSNLRFTLSLAWIFVCVYQLSWPRHEVDDRFVKSRKFDETVSTLLPCRNRIKATTGTCTRVNFGFQFAFHAFTRMAFCVRIPTVLTATRSWWSFC